MRLKILTIALLAIICMLIACFPTAASILVKKCNYLGFNIDGQM